MTKPDDADRIPVEPVVMPCPFCGASDIEILLDHVECRVCSAQGPYATYSDDDDELAEPKNGIELWNSRQSA